MATLLDFKLRAANETWIAGQRHQFDVVICLHMPNSLRSKERGWDDAWLQEKLRRYLNQLDRKVLKSAHRRRKEKIPRFVVLEHSPVVGWHVHAMLASSSTGLSPERLCQIIKLTWLRSLGVHGKGQFKEHLVWAQPHGGGYANYITKRLSASSDKYRSVDLVNTSLD